MLSPQVNTRVHYTKEPKMPKRSSQKYDYRKGKQGAKGKGTKKKKGKKADRAVRSAGQRHEIVGVLRSAHKHTGYSKQYKNNYRNRALVVCIIKKAKGNPKRIAGLLKRAGGLAKAAGKSCT